ncbi:bifunctional folylpolyglutamate synthase/dihydrofolate synthase [Avrilella dinanensis]|uniref:bifunctional folylpolyglutamate synthase/dihydrofolate synthase n=1 Tax=Avrilella dinanensis TaxID=2008672 RepID=UPI0024093E56|nr:folylpolyglutamate synthase/dihydrofolate synthase family protein [Avrilella dinanensis]
MNYQNTVEWLFARLPMYQKIGTKALNKSLLPTQNFLSHIGNPHHQFKSVHVAGTNGKGSVSSMIASVLQEQGYRVGLYTSPHLKDFRERIKINGEEISEQAVIDFVEKHQQYIEENTISFFELTVVMAFDYFARQQTDIAVIEVGMGGRLDSTNVITPLLSVITNIGLDHTAVLGNTLGKIAGEKAGIIKPKIPVVIGEKHTETEKVFVEIAQKNEASIYFAEDNNQTNLYQTDLKGNYQQQNIRTVRTALKILAQQITIDEKSIKEGLANVVKNTKLLGRWQVLNESPLVVADTAHNAHGLQQTMQQVAQQNFDKLYIVLGVVDDKDLNTIVDYLPKTAYYLFVRPNVARGLDAFVLSDKMRNYGFAGKVCSCVSVGYEEAMKLATKNDMIYIGGSTFVIAEILK